MSATMTTEDLARTAEEVVKGVDGKALLETVVFSDEVTLVLDKAFIVPVLEALRNDDRLAMKMLSDVTAVDYYEVGRVPRFDVVYHLFSYETALRLRVRCGVDEEEEQCRIDSVCGLWSGASFMERETFDMYGIVFDGSPDPRRIIMPENWQGYPLRKDFALGGSTSFYFKQDSNEYEGEPDDLIPRIRVQDSDI